MNAEDMKSKINSRTKAIMPVHLTGRMCEMNKIMRIAKKNIKVIEDCAQSIGSIYDKKKVVHLEILELFQHIHLKI